MTKFIKFFLSIILLNVLIACEDDSNKKTKEPLVKAVKLFTAEVNKNSNIRNISGIIAAQEESELSFRVNGRVEHLYVKKGDKVSKGQELATLNQNEYTTALSSAAGAYENAKSNMATQEKNYKRQKKLADQQLISKAEMESSEQAYNKAAGDLKIQEAALNDAKQKYSDTKLIAPFNGTISDVKIDNFAEIKIGETIFNLESHDKFEINLLVPETMINNIKIDDPVEIKIPSIAQKFSGKVSEIGAKAETSNAFEVVVNIPTESDILKAGMTAIVTFEHKISDAPIFLIPNTALDLRFFDKKTQQASIYKYIADPNNKDQGELKLTKISIIEIKGNMLIISDGISANDQIVIAGVSFLSNGQKVKPWNEDSKIISK
ncbi:MAG: efflux RND transporter periplasmic adaptor subunit [Rickettsiales bacterium]|nr:efflux RND transporter periplasmic adaptor subunit [Rickettsiales bacterium]